MRLLVQKMLSRYLNSLVSTLLLLELYIASGYLRECYITVLTAFIHKLHCASTQLRAYTSQYSLSILLDEFLEHLLVGRSSFFYY